MGPEEKREGLLPGKYQARAAAALEAFIIFYAAAVLLSAVLYSLIYGPDPSRDPRPASECSCDCARDTAAGADSNIGAPRFRWIGKFPMPIPDGEP